ncbi:hypothetical protein IFM89_008315 [Coptis chinensis]|uniref:CCHC-type domain-containing protein n=1 Tax=Coptis chinensis TaxID=261450 RepID=A0A835ICT8_9MAGN|nr:hypothetical protein IFM89_008315 [Coptis chinensis]
MAQQQINKTRLTFARSCIEVKSTLDLPGSVIIDIGEPEPVTIRVEYPWKAQQCNKCGEFGHIKSRCRKDKVIKKWYQIKQKQAPAEPSEIQKGQKKSTEADEVANVTRDKTGEIGDHDFCIQETNKFQCLEDAEYSDYEETLEALPTNNTNEAIVEDATTVKHKAVPTKLRS